MTEADDVEVVASGLALQQVSQWLGVPAGDVLQQSDALTADLFEKPRPSLLGLGARFVSHKSMEQSGLEHKLKQRLKRSADGSNTAAAAKYQPAQLDRFMQHRGKRRHGADEQGRQEVLQQHDSSDEEQGGKLSSLQQNKQQQQQQQQQQQHQQGGSSMQQLQLSQPGRKGFDRSQLLAMPVENMSKWQRKRMRQKEKAAAAAQHQQ